MGLEDCAQGKWDVPHFTAKAHIADYVREKHAGMISIFPSVAAFYTNFLEYARPRCAPLPAPTPSCCFRRKLSRCRRACKPSCTGSELRCAFFPGALSCVNASCRLPTHEQKAALNTWINHKAERCGRKGEDGVLTFAMAIRGDARFPWINPMTATGPVGAFSR